MRLELMVKRSAPASPMVSAPFRVAAPARVNAPEIFAALVMERPPVPVMDTPAPAKVTPPPPEAKVVVAVTVRVSAELSPNAVLPNTVNASARERSLPIWADPDICNAPWVEVDAPTPRPVETTSCEVDARVDTAKYVEVALVDVEKSIARFVMVLVLLLTTSPPERVLSPVPVIVPMLTRLPDESMRLVPPPAPVLIPVVPFIVVPVMVD